MKIKKPYLAVLAACGLSVGVAACNSDGASVATRITAIEFIGMPAPASTDEKADMYSAAKALVTYDNGTTSTIDLAYHRLFLTGDVFDGQVAGGLFDSANRPVSDRDGQMYSDSPDGTSLMQIAGLSVPGASGNPLAMVTQFEYKELPPNDGSSIGSFWSKLPATTGLSLLDQNSATGALAVKRYSNVSYADVKGGWIHCGSTLSAWNTHLSSEEYEPDAKVRGGGARAADSDDGTDIASFSRYYFGDPLIANPYHYGLLPEVSVAASGTASVVKHYATGRFAREMQIFGSDNRTSIAGDDGKATGLFMFVADRAADLSSGSLYAAKATQTSAANGGSFDLQWIKLGSASDAEIKAMVDAGIRFSDIFDVSNTDPSDPSYKKVVTYMGTEWLRLKPGKEKAAAFLETRRYAALLGATTEFTKMEYIAFNQRDKKFYVVISRIEASMADTSGDIQVARNDGGAIYELSTAGGKNDSAGNAIASELVGTRLAAVPQLIGGWNGGAKDAEGNQCQQDKICGPDNIVYVDSIRTLFIGEDTSRRNNNYVWAFNIDTRKLSRILSTPMNAEATGLMAAPNRNGFGYIMSNFQHPGENNLASYTGADKSQVLSAINAKWGNRKKAAVGYIGVKGGGALLRFD